MLTICTLTIPEGAAVSRNGKDEKNRAKLIQLSICTELIWMKLDFISLMHIYIYIFKDDRSDRNFKKSVNEINKFCTGIPEKLDATTISFEGKLY